MEIHNLISSKHILRFPIIIGISLFLSFAMVLFHPLIATGVFFILVFLFILLTNFDMALVLTILILPVAIKVPLGPLHLNIGEYFLIPLLFVGLIKGFSKGNYRKSAFDFSILIFMISAILSLSIAVTNEHAWGEFRKLLIALAFYLVIRFNLNSQKGTYLLINCFVISATFAALVGILQYFTGSFGFNGSVMNRGYLGLIVSGIPGSVRLVNGVFKTFNALASYLDIIFPLSLMLTFSNKKNITYSICSLVIFLGLLFSFSRGGLIAFAVSLVVIVLFYRTDDYSDKIKKYRSIILLTILIGLIVFIIKYLLSNRAYINTINFDVRVIIWESAYNVIKSNPILGVGLGKAQEYLIFSSRGWGTHSNYLGLLLERGILGLISFLILVIIYYRISLSNLKIKNMKMRNMNLGLLAGMTAFLVHSFVDDSFAFLIFLILFFSFIWSVNVIYKENQEHDQTIKYK